MNQCVLDVQTQGLAAGEATVPGTYSKALNAVDPMGLGDISVNTLSRVIGTSGLPAATIDRVSLSCFIFQHGTNLIRRL